MVDELDQVIDKAMADKLSDEDIQFIVGEWKAAHPPTPSPGAQARQQANERPADYLRQMGANMIPDSPGAAWQGVKDFMGGVGDTVSTVAKATAEVGSAAGNAVREVVGLQPHYGGTENIEKIAGVPGQIARHYGQYADADQRALMMRDQPWGVVSDAAGLVSAGGPAKAGASKVIGIVKRNPGLALDAAGVAMGGGGGMVGAVKRHVGRGLLDRVLGKTAEVPKPTGVKGASIIPANEADIAATVRQELESRIGSTPAASHGPERSIEEVTAAQLADREAVGPRAHATTEFTRENPNAGGALVPDTGELGADLSARLDEVARAPHAAVGNEAAAATEGYLNDQVASPARAGATTDFMRPPVMPNPNAGGTLRPRQVPGIVQQVNESVNTLRAGDKAELLPAASHPTTGAARRAVEPGSFSVKRTGQDPIVSNLPPKPKATPPPPPKAGPATTSNGNGNGSRPPELKNRQTPREGPSPHQEAMADPGIQALLEEQLQNHLRSLPNADAIPGVTPVNGSSIADQLKASLVEQELKNIRGRAKPTPEPPAGAGRATTSKNRSPVKEFSENDITEFAAEFGITREEAITRLKSIMDKRAARGRSHHSEASMNAAERRARDNDR